MKNIITRYERDVIYDNMTELLEKFDYKYTADAIYEIIDTWAEQKADLITAFKKHPNYVEGEFMIAFNKDWMREIDRNGASYFSNWMKENSDTIYENLPEQYKERAKKWNDDHPWSIDGIHIPLEAYWILTEPDNMAHQLLSERLADLFNRFDPSLRFAEGMKMSRAIGKLCKALNIHKLPDYNKEYAKYADSVNPLKITRHTIISINPIDYLTMSFGNSWASCHTIDKENTRNMPHGYEGQYSSGTISYMLDKVSMVFYTVDAHYDGNEYYFQNKINRCMFHYGDNRLVQGRVYPQSNDNNEDGIYKDIREIVQRVMSECLEIPNYWATKRGTYDISRYVTSSGTHYRDYNNFDNCCISFPKEYEWDGSVITIGHDPICIDCGCTHRESENINHCTNGRRVCADCGYTYHEDDMHYIGDEWYCEDCCRECECCECWVANDDTYWVEYENRYVCSDCRHDHYTRCDCCDELFRDYDTTCIESEDNYVCESCLDYYFTCCDLCNEYVRDRNAHYDEQTDSHYCNDCWEELNAEEENEEVC